MSGARRSVLRNTIFNWSAFFFAAGVSFFLAPFTVHRLGDAQYGIWVLLGSIVGYLGLLDLGVRGAVTRFVAARHAVCDSQGASALVGAALRLFGGLGLLAMVGSAGLALMLDRVFQIPPELVSDARRVLLLGGLTVAVSFVGGVFGGVVAGLQRFDVDGGLEIASTAIRAGAVVVALLNGAGLVTLSLIQLVTLVLRSSAAFVIVRRLYPELRPWRVGRVGPALRQLLSFSLFASLIHVAGIVIYQTDALVIGMFLPVGFVTLYVIGSSLAEYGKQLVGALARVVTPRVSSAEAEKGIGAVREVVLATAPFATLVTAPIAITFLLRGGSFIDLWMGQEYGQRAAPVLSLLAIVVWLAGGRTMATATLMGIDHHRRLAAVFAVEAVVNLVLSVVLVRRFGIVGVALGTVIPSVAATMGVIPVLLRRALHVPFAKLLHRVWLVPSFSCALFALSTYLVEQWVPATSIFAFAAQTALLLPTVALGAAFLMLSRGERHALAERVLAAYARLRRPAAAPVDVPITGPRSVN